MPLLRLVVTELRACCLPLLDIATFDDTGARLFEANWRPAERWALDEHRTRDGQALGVVTRDTLLHRLAQTMPG